MKKPKIVAEKVVAGDCVDAATYAANATESRDTIAAVNVAIDMGTSLDDALTLVRKHRRSLEAIADAMVGDQSIADTVRVIEVMVPVVTSNAGRALRPGRKNPWMDRAVPEMLKERRRGGSLDDFIASAIEEGEVDVEREFALEEIETDHHYRIVWNSLDTGQELSEVKIGVLKKWWTASGKK